MDDLNRDIRIAWERDYSNLILKTGKLLDINYFEYKEYVFRLGIFFKKLFVVKQKERDNVVAEFDIDELKSKYFLDILNPTFNELVLFELEYGFEWPFQEKNKKINQKEQSNEVII